MAINLEMPKKLQAVIEKGHQGAAEMLAYGTAVRCQ